MSPAQPADHPGAGTLWAYGLPDPCAGPSSPRRSRRIGTGSRPPSRGIARRRARLSDDESDEATENRKGSGDEWPPSWSNICSEQPAAPVVDVSPDALLARGVAEYTLMAAIQGGVLGRGKFSTVYKVRGSDGQIYAMKHTPLHPHHPLIAARLLREPTLMAQLPPHPCVVGVEGWVWTQGHFYLIETYAQNHVPLPDHPLPLLPSRAAYILDQLVSAMRDCLHVGRVCHRDLKGENILIDVETGDLLVIDLGLATHYSASEPVLTTCCGSPAFHSPEIVNALNHPPGAVTYYGPELDIWCLALTLLSLLLDVRFPLGPSHTSRHVMSQRVQEALHNLDRLYPPSSPHQAFTRRHGGQSFSPAFDQWHEAQEWQRVRDALRDFLDIDGERRIKAFERYQVGEITQDRVDACARDEANSNAEPFKQVSFLPTEVKYTLPLKILDVLHDGSSHADTGERATTLTMSNPSGETDRRIMSYIKYLLRSAGILYHVLPTGEAVPFSPSAPAQPLPPESALFGMQPDPRFASPSPPISPVEAVSTDRDDRPTLQLVVPIPLESAPVASEQKRDPRRERSTQESWMAALFRKSRRSASVPPGRDADAGGKPQDQEVAYIRCWIKVDCQRPTRHKRRGPGARSQESPEQAPLHRMTLTSSSEGEKRVPTTASPGAARRPGPRRHVTSPSIATLADLRPCDEPSTEGASGPEGSDATRAALAAAAATLSLSPLSPTHATVRPAARRTASASRVARSARDLQTSHPAPLSPLSRQISIASEDEHVGAAPAFRRSPSSSLAGSGSRPPSRHASSRGASRAPSRAGSGSGVSSGSAGLRLDRGEAPSSGPPSNALGHPRSRQVSDPGGVGASGSRPLVPRGGSLSARPSLNRGASSSATIRLARQGSNSAEDRSGSGEHRRPSRAGARVVISVSDARALPVIRRALDVHRQMPERAADPPGDGRRRPSMRPGSTSPDLQRGRPRHPYMGEKDTISTTRTARSQSVEDDQRLGRPRSRQSAELQRRASTTVGTGDPARLADPRRDLSTGRKLLDGFLDSVLGDARAGSGSGQGAEMASALLPSKPYHHGGWMKSMT